MMVAHRAQGDGQTERMNWTLEEYLRCFVSPRQDDWDIHLANAEFAVKSTVNYSTKLAPFKADIWYIQLNPLQLAAEQFDTVVKSRRGAEFHEHQAAILLRCRETLAFECWIGPYSVERKIHNHELNIQAGNRLHPVFNTGSLKPYNEPTRLSRPNEVVLANGSIGQIVKRLVKKRTRKRRTQFLVEWVGEEKQTWEPVENLSQVPNLNSEFETAMRKKRKKR
ncbi:hypothetical protein F442_22259 [Phytophthora nicotianae P10297]|uniref:Chromo domain-containing protein n=1 Tax=Phytophthora nicotianae P10297 TaxID=1317064 RepID=W2Y134_PHYNI|nr:hypothetical protein F442_22259 [Phytophthora nicotianae P10297]